MPFRWILKEKDYDESSRPIFIAYKKKRKISTRLVRPSWRRVLIISLVYALALNFSRQFYYAFFGRPTFFAVAGAPPSEAELREQKEKNTPASSATLQGTATPSGDAQDATSP